MKPRNGKGKRGEREKELVKMLVYGEGRLSPGNGSD